MISNLKDHRELDWHAERVENLPNPSYEDMENLLRLIIKFDDRVPQVLMDYAEDSSYGFFREF